MLLDVSSTVPARIGFLFRIPSIVIVAGLFLASGGLPGVAAQPAPETQGAPARAAVEAPPDSSGVAGTERDTTRLYEDPMPFSGWKVINLPTDRTLKGGNWLFLISHRFNPAVSEGYSALYGLDGPAVIYLSLGYALTDEWLVALARSNSDDNVELEMRYRLLEESGPSPLGLSVQGAANWLTEDRPNESRWRGNAFKGTAQVTLTRTVGERLGLAVVPGLTLNPDEHVSGEAPLVTLGLGARWKLQEKVALVAEWTPILSRSDRTVSDATRYATWSAGIEVTTEGHVFQVVASNNAGLSTDQYLSGGDLAPGNIHEGQFRLGFNIFRILDFSKF